VTVPWVASRRRPGPLRGRGRADGPRQPRWRRTGGRRHGRACTAGRAVRVRSPLT